MKIAYLVNQYPRGSHTFIRREIEALEAMGVEVSRYTLRGTTENLSDPADRAEQLRTRIVLEGGAMGLLTALMGCALRHPLKLARALRLAVQVGWTSEGGLLKHLAYLGEACVLLRWMHGDPPDHLHVHFGTNATTVAMLLHVLGGPNYSFTAHGPEEFDKPGLISLGEKILRARCVFAISNFGRSQLYRQVPRNHWDKIHIMRCGVDAQFLAGGPSPVPDTLRLISVGRLNEQKGQLLLVDAAAELAKRGTDFELVLVGDGEMRATLEARICALGVSDRVSITGWATNAEVKEYIQRGRALVLPSFAEGLPVVIMEALALGRPVLSTYVAGIPELVEPGMCGWLVPAGALSPLVDAMEAVLQTPVQRLSEMGAEGYRRVLEFHDASKNAQALLDVLSETRRDDPRSLVS